MASLDLLPLVRDGQQVMPGDTVALLLSNQLTAQLLAAMAELEKLENELDLLRSPPKAEEIAEAEAQVNASQATLQQLQRDFERVKGLREKDLATREEYEAAQSKVDVARAELDNREARLKLLKAPPKPEQEAVLLAQIEQQRARVNFLKTQEEAQSVVSPIGGTVQVTSDDGHILSILDTREIQVLVPVSDFDIELVAKDLPVLLKVRSYPRQMFTGLVTHVPVGAVMRDGKARFMVPAVFGNEQFLLTDGMTGYAKIDIGRTSLFSLIARRVASFIRVEFWSWW
jgi:HlyD family secretion protein